MDHDTVIWVSEMDSPRFFNVFRPPNMISCRDFFFSFFEQLGAPVPMPDSFGMANGSAGGHADWRSFVHANYGDRPCFPYVADFWISLHRIDCTSVYILIAITYSQRGHYPLMIVTPTKKKRYIKPSHHAEELNINSHQKGGFFSPKSEKNEHQEHQWTSIFVSDRMKFCGWLCFNSHAVIVLAANFKMG